MKIDKGELMKNETILNALKEEIPYWEKSNLTLEEAAAYSNIGINKIREMAAESDCEFILFIGRKKLIKRKAFDEYLESQYSI